MEWIIAWHRRDLRTSDLAILDMADALARPRGALIVGTFCLDRSALDRLDDPFDRRITFQIDALAEIAEAWNEAGSDLVVRQGLPEVEIPTLATALQESGRVLAVVAARDEDPLGQERDHRTAQALTSLRIPLHTVCDSVVLERAEVLNAQGTPFRVFTPYARAHTARLANEPGLLTPRTGLSEIADLLAPPGSVKGLGLGRIRPETAGFRRSTLPWPAGERAAENRLINFTRRMEHYDHDRDRPDLDGSSRLSADLRFGTLSVRAAFRAALGGRGSGARKWLAELQWREFWRMLLHAFPNTVQEPFHPWATTIAWDDPTSDPVARFRFNAWCEGRTGYPFVDAGMRQLLQTGWMHNRARMVVASFLTKDLHIDWRVGERWFARHLLDHELASNVGSWQWAASTGADSQPWFRIFNPVLQGKRWDPDGSWIASHVPELASVPAELRHEPTLKERKLASYPEPVVDHSSEREEALRRFRQAKSNP